MENEKYYNYLLNISEDEFYQKQAMIIRGLKQHPRNSAEWLYFNSLYKTFVLASLQKLKNRDFEMSPTGWKAVQV